MYFVKYWALDSKGQSVIPEMGTERKSPMNAPPTSLQNFQDGTQEGRAQVQPNKSPQVEDSQLTV